MNTRISSHVIPHHVVIIPDGNRRWAKDRGMAPWKGHEVGAEAIEHIIDRAHKLGVRCISFWGSSVDNLSKRPMEEKHALLKIYQKSFAKLIENPSIHKNQARISVIGRWREQFPSSLRALLEDAIDKTKHYSNNFLNFFLAYNGDEEMLSAIRSIVSSGVAPEGVNADVLKRHLYTSDLPEVDYLIRTGGEPHLSAGFMMWDIANAQLYFSDAYFPDFGPDAFEEAILEFDRRERRMGK